MSFVQRVLEGDLPEAERQIVLSTPQESMRRVSSVADYAAELDVERTAPVALEVRQSSLADRPPENVATLHVLPPATGEPGVLRLTARSPVPGLVRTVDEGPRRAPRLALGELATSAGKWPADIVAAMHRFSQDNADICKWINELRDHVDDLHVVVLDYTDFEIPWELLVLPAAAPGGNRAYLGVTVSIARWPKDPTDVDTYDLIPLTFDHVVHAGRIAGWIDRVSLNNHGREFPALAGLGARLEADVTAFTRLLTERLNDIALVYVAAHGRYSVDSMEFAIGADDEQIGLVLIRMSGMELHVFRSSRAIVFLNVCHAGRAIDDPRLGGGDPVLVWGNRLRGFPETFLEHGAKGVIASTGEVNDDDAAEMAEWMVARLGEPEGLSIPHLLRDWRARVRESLPASWNDWTEEDNRKLLTASMYVYYGNPFARLRVAPGEQHGR